MIRDGCLHVRMDLLVNLSPDQQQLMIQRQLVEIQHLDKIYHMRSILVTLCWEHGFDSDWPTLLEKFFAEIKNFRSDIEICVMAGSWFQQLTGDRFSGNPQIKSTVYVDFFLLRVWYLLHIKQQCQTCQSWNPANNNILFLTGRPAKSNRIRLLYRLLKTELAQNLRWSFEVPARDQIRCRQFLPEITDDEFAQLLKLQKSLDGQRVADSTGIPYGIDIYDSALFQIVSETSFDRCYVSTPFVTEKTYLAMINRRPFIVAGEFYTQDYLESWGFDTFRDLLAVPNYDNPDKSDFLQYGPRSSHRGTVITQSQRDHWHSFYEATRDPSWPKSCSLDVLDQMPAHWRKELQDTYVPPIENINEIRLDAIIENARYWQQCIKSHWRDVEEITDRNHRRLMQLGQENLDKFNEFTEHNNITFTIDAL